MPTAMNEWSEKLTAVEDFAPWSSPASAITPPLGEAPVKLAWRKASPERSTPGPLPYQMPKTPSTVAPGKLLILRAPDRGRGDVLVEARAEDDVVLLEQGRRRARARCRSAPAASRDSRNIPAGVETRGVVAQPLLDRQANERLHPGHVEPALGRFRSEIESCLRPGEGDIHESIPPWVYVTVSAFSGAPAERAR